MKRNTILTILTITCIFSLLQSSHAQILKKLEKKVERKVTQRIERKTDRAIDKGLDKVEGSMERKKETTPSSGNHQQGVEDAGGYISSKFDFIPGDKILFLDDFTRDAQGDFPARWRTNASGEIVTINKLAGKWLKVPANTLSFPVLKGALPENFTIEFDLFYPAAVTRPPVTFGFTEVVDPAKSPVQHKKIAYFHIPASIKDNVGYSTSLYSGRETIQSWPATDMAGKIAHVSMAVHKNRIRLYMNSNKVFDLPNGFEPDQLRNNFHFRAAPLIPAPKEGFYVSNLRVAEASVDARSQLLNKGSYSTTGIYFEPGSATIKPASSGILKEIGAILQDNPNLGIIIRGHTDNDGTEAINQELSQKRAEAVKTFLVNTHAVANQRIKTEGKGASQPVSDNKTEHGKAQNRRVEFITY